MNPAAIPQNINTDSETEDIELRDFDDEVLIAKLDSLKTSGKLDKKYSEIYKGGVYALRAKNRRENPDWMSQSANSFREILFILQKIESGELEKILNDYFAKSLTPQEVNEYRSYLAAIYKLFNDLTHHFSEVPDKSTQKYLVNKNLEIGIDPLTKENYFNAIRLYKEYLKLLVATALDMHTKIDDCVTNNKRDVDLVKVFFANSRDSKIYFLSLIDESWLQWLWTNGFFTCLKEPSEDPTKYGYQMPELDYLVHMAEKEPVIVAKIINSISISKATFNPEVTDRFQWIIGLLPIEQIKFLLPKMLSENWCQLMSPFHRSGYEYQKIVEKVKASNDYEAINLLARVILTLRSEEELAAVERFHFSDKLFYLSDVSDTGIYVAVLDPANTRKEESLKIFLDQLAQIVRLSKDKDECIFEEYEPFYLPDVDLFNIELDALRHSHSRSDIQNFVATCKKLIDAHTVNAGDDVELRRIYDTYIEPLPDSYSLYRLKLYVTSRHPELFKKEAKDLLFRLFQIGDRYTDIVSGAEYHHALTSSFETFDEATRREYVKNIFGYFGADLEDKDMVKWRKHRGVETMTCIKSHLTENEIKQSESLLGAFPEDGKFSPHPRSSGITSGFVDHKSPVDLPEYTVPEIIEHLKTDWIPSVLKEQFKGDSFLIERGAEGLGEGLKNDVKVRMDEYLNNINGFFDRGAIDPSYIYSILREVDEMLRNKKSLTGDQYTKLIGFFELIRKSGEAEEFERSSERSYLADWITVHKMMADILLNMLADIKESEFFKSNRDTFFDLIKYLLSIESSPNVEDEKPEYGEPFGVAINSVRGQAFRALTQFTYADSKGLADDVKVLYEHLLDTEPSNAVRFEFGHFLASFYFRDIPFIKSMMPKIFPKGVAGKEKLFYAAWEGYLANALYKELFEELREYYLFAISLTKEQYPDRKYLKGLDETLAAHIALAYTEFTLKEGDPIFDAFWSTPSEARHDEFVSFMGRHYLTRSQASEWLVEHKVDKEKIIAFWNWILQTPLPIEPKAFTGFGFWISPDEEIIDNKIVIDNITSTLKKANGEIDWEFGLMKHINEFAKINPQKTLEIITSLLILNGNLNPHHRMYFDAARQIGEPLEIIYQTDELKQPVTNLINSLIDKGSNTFWGLKEILK